MNPAHSHGQEAQAGSPTNLARRAALGDFGPEVMAWLCEGFRRHVVDGEQIEAALRLDRVSRLRARDDALRRAAALLTMGGDRAWPVSGRLALAVARQERLRSAPATPLEDALAQAFAAGVGVPTTQRQLYEIIR